MDILINTPQHVSVRLSKALLLYTNHDTAYATVHDVGAYRGKPTIGPGVPATRQALAALAAKLAAGSTLAGFLPEHTLYLAPSLLVWWRPPAPDTMFFKCPENDPRYAAIGRRHGRLPQPGLVFAVSAAGWHVHAVKGTARPGPQTLLCRAPHFNVFADGRICTGSVQLPDTMTPGALHGYERAFFGSNFTHTTENARQVRRKGGAIALWRDLLDGKLREFPQDALAPAGVTLAAWVKRFPRNQED